MERKHTMKNYTIFFTLAALIMLSGCVVQRDVVVVVTATPEPGAESSEDASTPGVPTATFTVPPPPTLTSTPSPSVPTEPPATPVPEIFPTPIDKQIRVAEQVFEHGRMFWVQPTDEIWVIFDDGRWRQYKNTFVEGESAESDPLLTPPPGLWQPIRGFGEIWRENEEVRSGLGWAKDTEYGYNTSYLYDHGGYVNEDNEYVPGPGVHTLVTLGKETVHFYEEGSTWAFGE